MTDEMSIEAGGATVSLENCTDAIELGISSAEAASYAALDDDQALELAHALIGMVMQRRRG